MEGKEGIANSEESQGADIRNNGKNTSFKLKEETHFEVIKLPVLRKKKTKNLKGLDRNRLSYKYPGQYKLLHAMLRNKKVKKISEIPDKEYLIGKCGHETDENSN